MALTRFRRRFAKSMLMIGGDHSRTLELIDAKTSKRVDQDRSVDERESRAFDSDQPPLHKIDFEPPKRCVDDWPSPNSERGDKALIVLKRQRLLSGSTFHAEIDQRSSHHRLRSLGESSVDT